VSELAWEVYTSTNPDYSPLLFCAACVKDMIHKLEGHVKSEPAGLICPVCHHTVYDADYWTDAGMCLRCALSK